MGKITQHNGTLNATILRQLSELEGSTVSIASDDQFTRFVKNLVVDSDGVTVRADLSLGDYWGCTGIVFWVGQKTIITVEEAFRGLEIHVRMGKQKFLPDRNKEL